MIKKTRKSAGMTPSDWGKPSTRPPTEQLLTVPTGEDYRKIQSWPNKLSQ